jgi:GT2 family glycosyltransferase
MQGAVSMKPNTVYTKNLTGPVPKRIAVWNFIKRIYHRLGKGVRSTPHRGDVAIDPVYQSWILKYEPSPSQLSDERMKLQSWSHRPKISIITPVFNPDQYALTQCIVSVLAQTYDRWELCLVDGGSDKAYVKQVLQKYADQDDRIRFVSLPKNLGIGGNSNEALKLATGDYVAFLDHDDTLAPFALYEVVKLLNHEYNLDLIFSDEDKISAGDEKRYQPSFKPDWSPDTFLSYNYLCHFAVVRRCLIQEIGGFRAGFDGAQDYDLLLRIVQRTNNIHRIPKVLYHWRATQGSAASNLLAKPYALDAAKRAIRGYLDNSGGGADVVDGLFPTSYRVQYKIRPEHKVSIIIPTRDKVQVLKQCVTSILNKTDYKNYEVLIIDNESKEDETFDYFGMLEKYDMVKVCQYAMPFNFSAINNFAAHSTDADHLLFLNNDTEVISPEWLSAMLEFGQRENVGAVGAKLYYPDNTVQHAGVIIGIRGLAAHVHKGFPRSSNGYMGRLNVIQNVSAVTAACMMVRKKVFEAVGGFDERLSHVFNDVDLCLKIRKMGYLIVFTPYAELYHHESASGASRGHEETPEGKDRFFRERDFVKNEWKDVIAAGDPYYNPHLTLEKIDFGIRL